MNSLRSYDSDGFGLILVMYFVLWCSCVVSKQSLITIASIGLHKLPRFNCPIFAYNKAFTLHRCASPWFPFSATKSHSRSPQGASLTVSVLYEYVKQNISHARLWIWPWVVMMDLASCEEHMLYYDGVVLFRNKHQHPSTQTCDAFKEEGITLRSHSC